MTPADEDEWDATQDSDALLSELLDEATNETDALLAELLGEEPASLDATQQLHQPNTSEPLWTNTTTSTDQQPRGTERIRMTRIDKAKHTLTSLRLEVSRLTTTLKRLQSDCNIPEPHVRKAMEIATVERLKRRRVEDERKQLRDAVYAQTQFLRGLKSVISTPAAASMMDLTRYLHSYTRLPRIRSMRWSEYAALATEARFQSAMDILCRETQKMQVKDDDAEEEPLRPSVVTPWIQSEVLRHPDDGSDHGVTSTSVFALETNDLGVALRGVCVALGEMPTNVPAYKCFGRKKQIVDPDVSLPFAADGYSIAYRVMGVDHNLDRGLLAVESHNVTVYKQTEDFVLLLEDFVDHDELHPHDETTNITRQAVGACLIRREICDDGVERAVCRVMRTRHYRFHEHTPFGVLRRFQQLSSTTLNANALLFRQLVNQSIAQEEDAFSQALGQLQACEAVAERSQGGHPKHGLAAPLY